MRDYNFQIRRETTRQIIPNKISDSHSQRLRNSFGQSSFTVVIQKYLKSGFGLMHSLRNVRKI